MKDLGTPIVLSDAGTVTGGASAGSWQPNLDKMRNQFGLPVEVTEMHFQAFVDLSTGVANPMALLKTRLYVANRPITNGYVLPQMLGWLNNRAGYNWPSTDTTQPAGQQSKATAFFRWVLPRPTYLQDGDPVQADFRWETPQGGTAVSISTNGTISVNFGIVGRIVDVVPDQIPVPYVSEFVGTTTGGLDSGDTNLMNICSSPLNMSGIVGRMFNGTGADSWTDDFISSANGWSNPWTGKTSGTRLKLIDSHDSSLIRNFTPFSVAFGPKFWLPCRRVLPPRDYLRVVLEAQPTAAATPAVAIVGWRNEAR